MNLLSSFQLTALVCPMHRQTASGTKRPFCVVPAARYLTSSNCVKFHHGQVTQGKVVYNPKLTKQLRKEAIAACYGIFSSCPSAARKTLSATFQNFVINLLTRQTNIAANEAQQGTLHALQLLRYTIPFTTKAVIFFSAIVNNVDNCCFV